MWTSCFLFSVLVTVACAYEAEDFSNGWEPVSSDLVFNQIRRGVTHAPRYTQGSDFTNADHLKNDNELFKVVSQEVTNDCEKGSMKCVVGDVKKNAAPRFQHDLDQNYFQPEKKVRKSKNIADKVRYISNVIPSKYNKIDFHLTPKNSPKLKEKFDYETTRMYEVTENVIEKDLQETVLGANEYNLPDKQNTTGLFQYLSKYNIKHDDNLQNYALSRRQKADNSVAHIPINSLQLRSPIRYNSLNHLPVNPLLAVLLSNYGFYLQGQYGIQNNYNNLYGYLASNNIHNNRPFGFYKLFSDTDAAH